ncbi:MAG: OmpA family protein [Bacteroidota bacterium]
MISNLRILFFLFALTFSATAQNLIPNGSFEEYQDNKTINWFQPEGAFYHFEIDKIKARTGEAYNGLCLWKWQNSEFLSVKLTQKLEKGSFYEIKFFARRDPHTTSLQGDTLAQVGIRFSPDKQKVTVKFVSTDLPNIVLPLDYSVNWQPIKGLYLAKGNEEYLTLGYYSYFNRGDSSCSQFVDADKYIAMTDSIDVAKKDSISNAIKQIKEEYPQSKTWQEIEKIKNKRKKKQYYQEFNERSKIIFSEIQIAVDQINRYYSSLINTNANTNQEGKCMCRVRYYFDDFELNKLQDDKLVSEKFILNNIYFDTDKSELKPESYPILDTLANQLLTHPNILIRIDGHTDNTGKFDKNIELSDNRAKSVVEYLISKGINENNISYKGFGSSKPIESNETSFGKSKNRRVEISIVKML